MATLPKEGLAHPFAFVGCWNKRGRGRDAVLDALRANPAGQNLLVLGGDNYYDLGKDKATGIKQHEPEVLREGFDALRGLPVLLSFGNHNIEKVGSFNVEAMQRHLATQYNWILGASPERYYRVDYADATFVVLDTNLCEPAEKAAFDVMLAWLGGQIADLKTNRKPYYIVQHEPIVAARQKKDKKTGEEKIIIALPFGDELLRVMAVYPPLAVLAADTHSYHRVNIYTAEDKPPIHQIVVGTGGAPPDRTTWDISGYAPGTRIPVDDYGRKLVVEVIPPSGPEREHYGFLQVDTSERSTFIPVSPWGPATEQRAGARGRTRKHRRRGSRRKAKFSRSR
jgi:hypothetical protein